MRFPASSLLITTIGLLAGCGGSAPEEPATPPSPAASASAPPASVATSRQIMLGLVIPAADVIWGVGSQAPADDAAWEKVQASAIMIAESAHLMMTGPRVVDQADWLTFAKAMGDIATQAAMAAGEKNADAVRDAGDLLYETCDTCHMKYMAARAGE